MCRSTMCVRLYGLSGRGGGGGGGDRRKRKRVGLQQRNLSEKS